MASSECDRQFTTRFINSNHRPREARARIILRENNDVDDAVFILDVAEPLHDGCDRHGLGFRHERHRSRNRIKYNFVRCYVEIQFFDCFGNPKQRLQTSDPDLLALYRTN